MSSGLPPILLPPGRQRPIFSVREVDSGWELGQFLGTAGHVYFQDRYWVPPLVRERRRSLDPNHNPDLHGVAPGLYFAEARNLAWADTPAGSLAVWFDPDDTQAGSVTALFGLFEASNEPEIAERLFDAAEMWLYQHVPGLSAIQGPMSLEPLRPPGLLANGYDAAPSAYLPYNAPYYADMLESAGYQPGLEWQTYTLALDGLPGVSGRAEIDVIRGAELAEQTPRLAALLAAATEPAEGEAEDAPDAGASPFARMPVYPVLRDWQQGGAAVWDAFPDVPDAGEEEDEPEEKDGASWPGDADPAPSPSAEELMPGMAEVIDVFGCAEPAPSRFGREGRLALRWLLPRCLAVIVEEGGEDVAAALALPDVSRGLRQSRGRLLPFGWLPYRLAAARTTNLRVLPILRLPGRQEDDAEQLLYAGLAATARELGYRAAEFGPVLSSDAGSIAALAALGARPNRAYHIYRKEL